MSEGPITESDLQAYADGRLEPERRVAVEAWLATHPEEAERIADYRKITKELRGIYDPVIGESLPPRFARKDVQWKRYALAAGLAAVGFLIGAAAGWELHESRPTVAAVTDVGPAMARRAAIAHATYSPEVRHPVEVGADQEAHLLAWLSKRLGAPLRAPQLDDLGYSLVGGRLLPGDTTPVANFMYQTQKGARLTLYVRTEIAGNRETAFRYAEEGRVRVFYWVDRKMGYAVSSGDLSKDELLKVANSVYQQLNP